MKQSESISKLAAALVKAQSELTNVVHDAKNPFFNSSYATLNAVIDHAKPVLSKHGLVVIQGNTPAESGIIVTTRILHESGEWMESALNLPLTKNDPQSAGSAITYGRRYALSAILGIASEEDDDGNKATHTAAPKPVDKDPGWVAEPPKNQKICPEHGEPMIYHANGQYGPFYSHKMPDGTYCNKGVKNV